MCRSPNIFKSILIGGRWRNRYAEEGYPGFDDVLEGLELGVVYFPENLPDLLVGFGIQASYTALDASQEVTQYNDQGEAIGMLEVPVFQVSDSSYSVVLAYDKNALDTRLSYVWRDEFLNNLEAAQFASSLGVYRKAETSMDFQASYDVMDNRTTGQPDNRTTWL